MKRHGSRLSLAAVLEKNLGPGTSWAVQQHAGGGWGPGPRKVIYFLKNITAVFTLAEQPDSGATWRVTTRGLWALPGS